MYNVQLSPARLLWDQAENINDENPYNVVRGGFLKEPVDFLTDVGARKLFKQKLRYIVARWGYITNLFSWEWWNEVKLTDGLGDLALLTPWLREMNLYLGEIDPHRHLIS